MISKTQIKTSIKSIDVAIFTKYWWLIPSKTLV